MGEAVALAMWASYGAKMFNAPTGTPAKVVVDRGKHASVTHEMMQTPWTPGRGVFDGGVFKRLGGGHIDEGPARCERHRHRSYGYVQDRAFNVHDLPPVKREPFPFRNPSLGGDLLDPRWLCDAPIHRQQSSPPVPTHRLHEPRRSSARAAAEPHERSAGTETRMRFATEQQRSSRIHEASARRLPDRPPEHFSLPYQDMGGGTPAIQSSAPAPSENSEDGDAAVRVLNGAISELPNHASLSSSLESSRRFTLSSERAPITACVETVGDAIRGRGISQTAPTSKRLHDSLIGRLGAANWNRPEDTMARAETVGNATLSDPEDRPAVAISGVDTNAELGGMYVVYKPYHAPRLQQASSF